MDKQVSFVAFALSRQRVDCTPSAAEDAAPVVAHGLGVCSGGECTLRSPVSDLRFKRCARLSSHPRFLAGSYGVYFPCFDGVLDIARFSSRARAFYFSKRYSFAFVDLGVAV